MNADQEKWAEISNAYATEPDERTEWQRKLAYSGLCRASSLMDMPYELPEMIHTNTQGYWWPARNWEDNGIPDRHTRQHDLYRATFAAFMAALSPKDIKEMLECQ